MLKRSFPCALAMLFALCITATTNAQQTTFANVANGVVAPSSIKIAELTPDFKAVRFRSEGESTPGMMGGLTGLLMMSGMSGSGGGGSKMMPAMLQLGALSDLAWTKGQTVELAGHDFIITYRLNTGLDPSSLSGPSAKMAADLSLSLIRADSVISISPDPSMTPDKLRKTLVAAGATFDAPSLHTQASNDETITASILLPVFAQAKVAAQETVALSNAKQIAISALLYASDYDDQLPYVQGTDQFRKVTYPYMKNDAVWKTSNPNGGGFRFAMNLAGVSETNIDSPAEAPMIYEANAWPDGRRVVAFADGHAKRVNQYEWSTIEPRLKHKYRRTAKSPIKG